MSACGSKVGLKNFLRPRGFDSESHNLTAILHDLWLLITKNNNREYESDYA